MLDVYSIAILECEAVELRMNAPMFTASLATPHLYKKQMD